MLKTGVYDQYGLNSCTWMNYRTCPQMSNEVKADIIKG